MNPESDTPAMAVSLADPNEWTFVTEWDRALWAAALLIFGVFDAATTLVGLLMFDGTEKNPVLYAAFEGAGVLAFAPIKTGAMVLAFVVWAYLRRDGHRYADLITVGMVVVGTVVVAWNMANLYLAWLLGGA